ncbi:hypothetical protein QBC42DRAFT_174526 [Cladorrhinum samala]|uniref:Uncharacterized protein n=1 Tax=Cladorrhinum samala TaxID=585594 RepID=A0AAV9HTT7_9PEZI|nr:hypothetical protein QBC42DRAFT_174526 [Cladorrhinum samala]
MARKRKSGASRVTVAMSPKDEIDSRPESSPYKSPTCTLPFASPLLIPQEVLLRSPKLHAAYEGNLPELSELSEDVGHVLVHYLHTGKYETLKPRSSDDAPAQTVELHASIQAYAAARTYELPELMKLAEAQIERFGEGLPLPTLLEVVRDAHPTLSDSDDWFMDFLRARIRPHLRDTKTMRDSDFFDRLSIILAPNRVLLRTVLELFCENIGRASPAPHHHQQREQQHRQAPQAEHSIGSSPETSRAGSPPPPNGAAADLLDLRSRSIVRDDSQSSPSRKRSSTVAPLDKNVTAEGTTEEPASLPVEEEGEEEEEEEEAQTKPVFDLDALLDEEPEQVKETEKQFEPLRLTETKPAPKAEAEAEATADSETVKREAPSSVSLPQKQRLRADSGKVLELDGPAETGEFKALPILEEAPAVHIPIPASMPALELSSIKRSVLRQADSGFWEATPSPASSSIAEIEGSPIMAESKMVSGVEGKAELEAVGVPEFKRDHAEEDAEIKAAEEGENAESSSIPIPESAQLIFSPKTEATQLPSHFDLPAEILESLPVANNEPETTENEKEKSVSPQVLTESSNEEAQTSAQPDISAPEAAGPEPVSVPAEQTAEDVDAPHADDASGPADTKEAEHEPRQPAEHAELASIPEQLEPVEPQPVAKQQKPIATANVEVIPAIHALQVAKPTSSSSSLHLGGLHRLRKSRSRRSHRGSTVSLSAPNTAPAVEPEIGTKEAPIPIPAPAPAQVSGSGGWKKKWLRYPVLFGRGT